MSTDKAVTTARRRSLITLQLAIGAVLVSLLPLREGYCADSPQAERTEVTANPAGETGKTEISMFVWVGDVMRIDSVAQTFAANVAMAMSWRDPRLASTEPALRRYNYRDVWHPNWLITNAVGSLDRSFPETVSVAPDGTVTYVQRLIGTFAQPHDLRAFPFDHTTFSVHFAAAGHRPGAVEFVTAKVASAGGEPLVSGIASQLTLQDWGITGSAVRPLPYKVTPTIEIPGYAFEFQAERYSRHYMLKVIIPLLLIVMMSWGAFWFDASMGGMQISVCMSSMLTLIAYRFSVGSDVPKVPYLTELDSFILISSILVFLTLVEVIVTTTLVCNKREDLARKIDLASRYAFPIAYVLVTTTTFML